MSGRCSNGAATWRSVQRVNRKREANCRPQFRVAAHAMVEANQSEDDSVPNEAQGDRLAKVRTTTASAE